MNRYHEAVWTPTEDAAAQKYLSEGKSFAEIALLIHRPRNGVIGRAHRKKWVYDNKRGIKKNCVIQKTDPIPDYTKNICIPSKAEVTFSSKPQKAPTGKRNLRNAAVDSCRFIIGDPKHLTICAEKTIGKTSWCEHHKQLVYRSEN